MNKPSGYDSAKAKTGFQEALEIKPFIGIIVNVLDNPSKNGNEMMTLHLDVAEGNQKGFFEKKFTTKTKFEKKWHFCHYRLITEENTEYLKGDIESIEKSNPGFVFDFNDIQKIIGLKIGVNPRSEEYAGKDGNIYSSPKPLYLFPIQDIDKQKVLKTKKIAVEKNESSEQNNNSDSSDLPF